MARQAAGEEVFEGRTRVGAAALPLADDVVALGDEVCSTPEVQVWERGAEVFHCQHRSEDALYRRHGTITIRIPISSM